MYKIPKFSKKENRDIKDKFKRFNNIEYEVWVADEIESHITRYIRK